MELSQKTATSSAPGDIAHARPVGLLALPQEILDRIAAEVMVLPYHIFVRWVGKYKRRIRGDEPGVLNLAKTCRRLYLTCIKQFYASNEFLFKPPTPRDTETASDQSDPPALTGFIRRIGRKTTMITLINLQGYTSDAELSMLSWLPNLRELYIEISGWTTHHVSLKPFYQGLEALSPHDVPSLRVLFITMELWALREHDPWGDDDDWNTREEIQFDGRCGKIEAVVDELRTALHREDGSLTVHLREGLTLRQNWGYLPERPGSMITERRPRKIVKERVRRDYVSRGVYASIVRGEVLLTFCN